MVELLVLSFFVFFALALAVIGTFSGAHLNRAFLFLCAGSLLSVACITGVREGVSVPVGERTTTNYSFDFFLLNSSAVVTDENGTITAFENTTTNTSASTNQSVSSSVVLGVMSGEWPASFLLILSVVGVGFVLYSLVEFLGVRA